MPTKYTVRIPSNVQYGYYEIEADNFSDLAEAELTVLDYLGQQPADPPQAVAAVKKAFGKTTEVKSGGFGRGQQSQQSLPDRVELGEHDGYTITLNTTGKWGPYLNAYNKDTKDRLKNTNLPKGMDPSQVDLDKAIEILSEAA